MLLWNMGKVPPKAMQCSSQKRGAASGARVLSHRMKPSPFNATLQTRHIAVQSVGTTDGEDADAVAPSERWTTETAESKAAGDQQDAAAALTATADAAAADAAAAGVASAAAAVEPTRPTEPQEATVSAAADNAVEESSATSPGPSRGQEEATQQLLDSLKLQLLAAVSSLDRGIAANVREAKEVDELASELEAAGGQVVLQWKTSASSPNSSSMEKLGGTWRLIYSSGFNGGSLGGMRPGPPAALFPLVLGQVYQVIDVNQGKLDNIVEFLFSYPLPRLPFLSSSDPQSPAVRLTLGHDFQVLGEHMVEIVYESTAAQLQGTELLDSFPKLAAPLLPDFLRPPKAFRSATFDVTYLDSLVRITRGDRGELRIYLRDEDLTPVAAAMESVDLD